MITELKNNFKIKIISLLSAMVLWTYVMAIVDPEETKLFENIPVTITNINELNEKNLIIYPEKELTTDIYVTGKLSNIKKVSKDDISVYGQINSPMEGKNQIYLKVSTSQRISYDFKNSVMIVTLEKLVNENKNININISGNGKNDVDSITLEDNINKIIVSGPRTLVDKVKNIVGTVNVDNNLSDFSQSIKLEPVDYKGKVVEGVKLEKNSISANVTLLTEKVVPIKLNLSNNIESDINYEISQDTVTIKGKKDIVDSIDYIESQPIDLSQLSSEIDKDVYLQIPNGIAVDTKFITIKKVSEENTISEYIYTPEEIDIRNNINNIDRSTIKIPDKINVSIEYLQSEGLINKDDIKLYIDLNELSSDNTCKIKYDIEKINIEKINIEPDIVTVEKLEI